MAAGLRNSSQGSNMPPTLDQRLAERQRPAGRAVMRQRWSKLAFLHWRVDPEMLQSRLPAGLHLDLHKGEAWLGIVPFYMQRIRPVGLPPLPWLSWFLELNVRTYVHDDDGRPGVWFLSLDCNQPIAVEIARRCFHLPYEHARMKAVEDDVMIHYECRRSKPGPMSGEAAEFHYGPAGPAAPAAPGTLDFFLAERYLLFSVSRDGTIHRGSVHHAPYLLAPARLDRWSIQPAAWNHLDLPLSPPDSALWVDHVDVDVFPLE